MSNQNERPGSDPQSSAPTGTNAASVAVSDGRTTDDEGLLSAYVDGELDRNQAAELQERLDASPELEAEVEDLRELLQAVGNLPAVTAPPDFYDKVHRKLRRNQFVSEQLWTGLSSLPFQLVSIIVVILIAALYMMLQLDLEHAALERDPTVADDERDPPPESGPAPAKTTPIDPG